jgi:uncharacterized damage-inducible protein DinB
MNSSKLGDMDNSIPLMYNWVKRTRDTLFDFTESLPPEIYTFEHPDFAYGSLRNIQAHIAGCYEFWLAEMALKLESSPKNFELLLNAPAMRAAFVGIDALVLQALEAFQNLDAPLELTLPEGNLMMVSQRWLILHPITHEFHHKGQLLALARVLGHPLPEDMFADLVTP